MVNPRSARRRRTRSGSLRLRRSALAAPEGARVVVGFLELAHHLDGADVGGTLQPLEHDASSSSSIRGTGAAKGRPSGRFRTRPTRVGSAWCGRFDSATSRPPTIRPMCSRRRTGGAGWFRRVPGRRSRRRGTVALGVTLAAVAGAAQVIRLGHPGVEQRLAPPGNLGPGAGHPRPPQRWASRGGHRGRPLLHRVPSDGPRVRSAGGAQGATRRIGGNPAFAPRRGPGDWRGRHYMLEDTTTLRARRPMSRSSSE